MKRGHTILRATPFHARAAEANRDNAWIARNGVTLAGYYEGAECEAVAARVNAAMADISWRRRTLFQGAESGRFLSRFLTRDPNALASGEALKALWLSDAGGVRGAGVVARNTEDSFVLAASAPDMDWIAPAARKFGVALRDVSDETGGLALIGPYARKIMEASGIPADLEPLAFRTYSWRGIDVTLSRWGEHGGYEIWCGPDDGVLVWDRLMRAGRHFGIVPAGVAAMDILDIEAGVARPGLDYDPARDANGAEPQPSALGLERLIDDAHTGFNGRRAYLAGRSKHRLVGLEFDTAEPAPFASVMLDGNVVGRTIRSVYSPALRRAIALAQIETDSAAPGNVVTLASSRETRTGKITARIVSLPFLPGPNDSLD